MKKVFRSAALLFLCTTMYAQDISQTMSMNLQNVTLKEFFKNPKTKTAALLSGCKNICSVELVKDLEPDKSFGKLWAAEWGEIGRASCRERV